MVSIAVSHRRDTETAPDPFFPIEVARISLTCSRSAATFRRTNRVRFYGWKFHLRGPFNGTRGRGPAGGTRRGNNQRVTALELGELLLSGFVSYTLPLHRALRSLTALSRLIKRRALPRGLQSSLVLCEPNLRLTSDLRPLNVIMDQCVTQRSRCKYK